MDKTETEYEFFFEWEIGGEPVDLVVHGKKGRDYPALIDYERGSFPAEMGEFEIESVRRQGETVVSGKPLTDEELSSELIEAIEDHFWNVIHY